MTDCDETYNCTTREEEPDYEVLNEWRTSAIPEHWDDMLDEIKENYDLD